MNVNLRMHFFNDVIAVMTEGIYLIPFSKLPGVREGSPAVSESSFRHFLLKFSDLISGNAAAYDLISEPLADIRLDLHAQFGKLTSV